MTEFMDALMLTGDLHIQVWHVSPDNSHYPGDEQRVRNLTPLTGRNLARDLLWWQSTADGPQPAGLNKFAIGISTAAFTAASTRLGTEVFRDAFTSRTETDGTLQIKYYLPTTAATSNPTLYEAALYGNNATTAANNGTMYAATIHAAIAKTTSVAATYTWTLSFSTSSTGSTG